MKKLKRFLAGVLCAAALAGCAAPAAQNSDQEGSTAASTETETSQPTAPADTGAADVTCLGSYTGAADDTQVAAMGQEGLTNRQLAVWYLLTVMDWSTTGQAGPDWSVGLDAQLREDGLTWQQFFLGRALNAWAVCQALELESRTAVMALDPEYLPNEKNYETYFKKDMPGWQVLYGAHPEYEVSSLHQSFLDTLPQVLEELDAANALGCAEEDALEAAELLNRAYMYLADRLQEEPQQTETAEEAETAETETTETEPTETEPAGPQLPGDARVNFRHILYCGEDRAEDLAKAEETLRQYGMGKFKNTEQNFAVLANQTSQDEGSRLNGGLYSAVSQGQMLSQLDSWLFDGARQPGDTVILESELGVHVLYYSGKVEDTPEHTRLSRLTGMAQQRIQAALETTPPEYDYGKMRLPQVDLRQCVTPSDLLYPDIAHEFIPDYLVHLQQDYPKSRYGAYPLPSWGCGITTLSMMATYMCDQVLTPANLAARYGKYCLRSGTDASLMVDAPPQLGFYVKAQVYDYREALEYIRQGYPVICLQHKGYFTRGGHYLLLRELVTDEEGNEKLSIRDSNIYNYGKLPEHQTDQFPLYRVWANCAGFWVYEKKITRIPACARCGEETGLSAPEGLLLEDYTCEICREAVERRDLFLELLYE